MFAQLLPLIQERPITIQTSAHDGKIFLMVAPKKLKDDENPAFWTPFSVSGTADELDRGLAEVLASYVKSRSEVTVSLTDSLKAAENAMKAAAEEAKKKAAEKVKKPVPKAAATVTTGKPATAGTAATELDEDDDDASGATPTAAIVAEQVPQVTLF